MYLMERGMYLFDKDVRGCTPLDVSLRLGKEVMSKLFVKYLNDEIEEIQVKEMVRNQMEISLQEQVEAEQPPNKKFEEKTLQLVSLLSSSPFFSSLPSKGTSEEYLKGTSEEFFQVLFTFFRLGLTFFQFQNFPLASLCFNCSFFLTSQKEDLSILFSSMHSFFQQLEINFIKQKEQQLKKESFLSLHNKLLQNLSFPPFLLPSQILPYTLSLFD